MNLQRLNPWNWFKHEENRPNSTIAVKRNEATTNNLPASASAHNHWSMQHLQHEIDRLFDQTFRGFGFSSLRSRWR